MVRVHIRLDLENECGHARLGGRHDPLVRRLRPRRRRHGGERVEQIADAEILERAAEEDRRHVALGKSLRVEPLAGMAHEIKFPAECRRVEPGVQGGDFGDRHFAQPAGSAGIAVEQAHAAGLHVDCADEIATASDRPGDRRGIERQCLLDLVDEFERIAAFAIHLVDESDDRNVAQPAYLEQLARSRLDALGSVDHHHGRIDRGEGPIGVFREVLVAGGIKQIEDTAVVLEGHHRGNDGDSALAFDGHPVRTG